MWPDRVSNPGPLTYESGALSIVLRDPAHQVDGSGYTNSASDICSPGYPKTKELFETAGPGCSKLTMSLVKVSLKFQTLISQISRYFLLKKCEKLLH